MQALGVRRERSRPSHKSLGWHRRLSLATLRVADIQFNGIGNLIVWSFLILWLWRFATRLSQKAHPVGQPVRPRPCRLPLVKSVP